MTELARFTFEVPMLYWPAIYQPVSLYETHRPMYGVLVEDIYVPEDLEVFLKPAKYLEKYEVNALRLNSRNSVVVLADRDIGTIMQCADANNISRDLLISEIPASVSVVVYALERNERFETRSIASLRAIKVSYDDMLRRYDDICASFFK